MKKIACALYLLVSFGTFGLTTAASTAPSSLAKAQEAITTWAATAERNMPTATTPGRHLTTEGLLSIAILNLQQRVERLEAGK